MKSAPLFEAPAAKVISVQQPWAWLIISGRKAIENRTWQTQYRGPLYIHAGTKMHSMSVSEIEQRFELTIDQRDLQFGAIIGRVDLVDIVTRSTDPYFFGPYGWVLENPEPMQPIPLRGQMGLFDLPMNLKPPPATLR